MKRNVKSNLIFVFVLLLLIPISCRKKDKNPTVKTSTVTNITGTTALSGGTITNGGSEAIIARGVCWSISDNPTINDTKTIDGANVGTFISNLIGLNSGTKYFVRAYAINGVGTGYGESLSFSTLGQIATASTLEASNIQSNSATLNGTVNSNYLSTVITFEYGTTTSYGSSVTATQSPATGNTSINVSAILSNLTIGTTYHYKIVAKNSLGTTNGNDVAFTTLGKVPTAIAQDASNIQSYSSTLNGTVNANSLSTAVTFEYGTSSSYGKTVTAVQSPVSGNNSTSVSVNISNLTKATTYHYRITASNSLGTIYSNDITFSTIGDPPLIVTNAASQTATSSAQLNGNVIANNAETIVTFDYGTDTSYGKTVTAIQSPVSGNILTPLSAVITGLIKGTTYHYRIVAKNSAGTTYGADKTFSAVYAIGEFMFGGTIFYVDETGDHGLVVSDIDTGRGKWGCYPIELQGAHNGAIGSGYQNTKDIVLECPDVGIAAKLCYDLVRNGYDDWYLPSISELGLIKTLYDMNRSNFANSEYWSSTQVDRMYAYTADFYGNVLRAHQIKDRSLINVRAIRSF